MFDYYKVCALPLVRCEGMLGVLRTPHELSCAGGRGACGQNNFKSQPYKLLENLNNSFSIY